MRKLLFAAAFVLICAAPVFADDDLKGPIETNMVSSSGEKIEVRDERPAFAKKHFPLKVKHPLIYKIGTPVRWCSRSCIWLGEKSHPYHPFLATCGYMSNMVTPFLLGFLDI